MRATLKMPTAQGVETCLVALLGDFPFHEKTGWNPLFPNQAVPLALQPLFRDDIEKTGTLLRLKSPRAACTDRPETHWSLSSSYPFPHSEPRHLSWHEASGLKNRSQYSIGIRAVRQHNCREMVVSDTVS
jgi:hypothetical protein